MLNAQDCIHDSAEWGLDRRGWHRHGEILFRSLNCSILSQTGRVWCEMASERFSVSASWRKLAAYSSLELLRTHLVDSFEEFSCMMSTWRLSTAGFSDCRPAPCWMPLQSVILIGTPPKSRQPSKTRKRRSKPGGAAESSFTLRLRGISYDSAAQSGS